MSLSLRTLVDLQLHGVRGQGIEAGRHGGAGPSETKAFMLDGHCVMLPVGLQQGAFPAQISEGCCTIAAPGLSLCAATVARPKFYDLSTADGIAYTKIALLHGRDCLASTVLQNCARYAREETRCRFCALGKSLKSGATIARKTPQQLTEVAEAAKRLDGVTHVTLTSGTTVHRDTGIYYCGECAEAITAKTGLPVQLQFEPPEDFGLFRTLHRMQVANVSMHVESLDENVRKVMVPGKAEISLDQYFEAFRAAVEVFGRNRVGTYVIIGMGEDKKVTLERCAELCDIGVYPNVVPLHKLPGTDMENAADPDIDYLVEIYDTVGGYLRKNGLTVAGNKAGCGHCGACSLLQFTEAPACGGPSMTARQPKAPEQKSATDTSARRVPEPRTIRHIDTSTCEVSMAVVQTPEELELVHAIRRAVFCEEQGIFKDDDTDEHDAGAIHILARVNGEPAGCVRCYERTPGIWVGGRLAVLKKYRSHLGASLVKKAVSTMEELSQVRRFFAIVQIQNVRFFRLLRWKTRGIPFLCQGVMHQQMEKPLKGRQS